jgi:biopolymer transport protein ExbD
MMSAHSGSAAQAGKSKRRWRLSGNKKPHIDVVRNDINVTPLVDVMLVLLIIFMLMTLVMGRGQEVPLPGARNYSEEKDAMQPVVSVDKNGTLYVEKTKLGALDDSTLKEMQSQVEAIWAAPKNPAGVGRVYFKADLKVTYEKVYPVLEYMNKTMGMSNVDLAIAKDAGEK